MSNQKETPKLRGENLYVPFVGAIIARELDGEKQILVQIRHKETDSEYSGAIEIPGGKMQAFEDVYDTVRREVKEESGLDITFIEGENDRKDYANRGDTSSLIEPFCVTQMSQGPFIGLIFLCQAKGEPIQETDETKQVQWMNVDILNQIVNKEPERVYTAFLAPLKQYFEIMEH